MTRPTALIAEDEPLLAAGAAGRTGAGLGPSCRSWPRSATAQRRWTQALALRPDVLFLDIRMPGLSGLEAARALAEDWPHGTRLSRCWCSSPPTTSTRCRPSRRRRWTTCSSRCSGERLAQRAAPGCSALWPTARARHAELASQASSSCARCSARRRQPAARRRLEVIQAQVGATVHLVPVSEVLYFEAADKYLRVLTAEREHLIRTSLRELLPQLDPQTLLAGSPRHGGARTLHRQRPARRVGQGLPDVEGPQRDADRQPALRAPVQGHVGGPGGGFCSRRGGCLSSPPPSFHRAGSPRRPIAADTGAIDTPERPTPCASS